MNRVRVPPRAGSVKIEMKGIFVGAKVVQGHDWEWGGQDGGENAKNELIDAQTLEFNTNSSTNNHLRV